MLKKRFSKLLFVLVGLLLSLKGGVGPCAAQRRQPTRDATPEAVRAIYKNIRQVDFNNFVFNLPTPIGVDATIKGEQIKMRQGIGTGTNPEGGCEYRVESVLYGFLISDEGPDAVIVLGCSLSPGTGYSNAGYVYGLRQGQPTLLAEFQSGGRVALILGIAIANTNLIVIREDADSDPLQFQAINYKWNGHKLIEGRRSAIPRIQ